MSGSARGALGNQRLYRDRKPTMLVAVALANRMARIIRALTGKDENYRAPAAL